jgi:iron complex transport system permease protein
LAGAVAQGLFRNPLADPLSARQCHRAPRLVLRWRWCGSGCSSLVCRAVNRGVVDGAAMVSVFSSNVWVRLGLTGAAFAGAVHWRFC